MSSPPTPPATRPTAPRPPKASPAAPRPWSPPPAPPPPPSPAGPDLSSLVSTAKGWDGGPSVAPTNGSNGTPAIAIGSQKGPAPKAPDPDYPIVKRETFAASKLVQSENEPLFDPMASFGSGMLARKPKRQSPTLMYVALGGAALAVVAAVVIITMTGKKTTKVAAPNPPPPTQVAGDQNTGFDLYVNPPGVVTWRLDGEARTDKLPSRIRGITPGAHNVAIDAPPGFMSQNQPITVEAGKAPKIEIVLQPLDITGKFDSQPPGAAVSLIIDGKRTELGPSPQTAKLDPRKSYQVLFEKAGYVSVNKPILFGGSTEEKVLVNLEKAGTETPPVAPVASHTPGPVTHPETHPQTVVKTDTPKTDTPVETTPKGNGTLLLGSKPPCDVFIDGSSTGEHTPHKFTGLPAGKHKVTLVNNEFGIKESFTVEIKADGTEKQIKDFSDRLPK